MPKWKILIVLAVGLVMIAAMACGGAEVDPTPGPAATCSRAATASRWPATTTGDTTAGRSNRDRDQEGNLSGQEMGSRGVSHNLPL